MLVVERFGARGSVTFAKGQYHTRFRARSLIPPEQRDRPHLQRDDTLSKELSREVLYKYSTHVQKNMLVVALAFKAEVCTFKQINSRI